MKHLVPALTLPLLALVACTTQPADSPVYNGANEMATDAMAGNDMAAMRAAPPDDSANDAAMQTGGSWMTPDNRKQTEPADAASGSHRFASWEGLWPGVEGTYVVISPTTPEHYRLEMQYDLDHKAVFEGRDSEHGIQFERGDKTLSLTRASGDDTGLKYLAGKSNCLKVMDGEGYCRPS